MKVTKTETILFLTTAIYSILLVIIPLWLTISKLATVDTILIGMGISIIVFFVFVTIVLFCFDKDKKEYVELVITVKKKSRKKKVVKQDEDRR